MAIQWYVVKGVRDIGPKEENSFSRRSVMGQVKDVLDYILNPGEDDTLAWANKSVDARPPQNPHQTVLDCAIWFGL
ncbi:MAG: hypothetical protein ACKPKO_51155 [Candidatus Fonsibacter sp.]